MRIAIALLAIAAPLAAAAQSSSPAPTYHQRTLERYCEKLRESPVAFVQHVHRLRTIHGYTYSDFAPAYPGAPVKADCRVPAERVAEVHALLAMPKDTPM